MNALAPYTESGGHTYEDYYQWWVQGAHVYQQLTSIPIGAVDAVDMRDRYEQLIGRWIDPANAKAGIQPPDTLGPVVDDVVVGNLLGWVKQARTLIYYIAYEERPADTGRRHSATGPTTGSDGSVAADIDDIPGYTRNWHWPWIEGWDDPAQRKALLRSDSGRGGFKKMVLAVGISAAAIWAGKKLLGKKSNPADPPEETWEEYE